MPMVRDRQKCGARQEGRKQEGKEGREVRKGKEREGRNVDNLGLMEQI